MPNMKNTFITGKEIYSLYLSLAISFALLFIYAEKQFVFQSLYVALGLLVLGTILLSKFNNVFLKVSVQVLMGFMQAGVIMAIILSLKS